VLSFIAKLIFFLIVVQLFAGLRRLFRAGTRKTPPAPSEDRVKKPEYGDLTPYEIEDAEYEDLPKERR